MLFYIFMDRYNDSPTITTMRYMGVLSKNIAAINVFFYCFTVISVAMHNLNEVFVLILI